MPRYSVIAGDPGEGYWPDVDVFFNGIKQNYVLTADEEEGFVLRYVTDDNDQIKVGPDSNECVTEKLRGRVQVVEKLP